MAHGIVRDLIAGVQIGDDENLLLPGVRIWESRLLGGSPWSRSRPRARRSLSKRPRYGKAKTLSSSLSIGLSKKLPPVATMATYCFPVRPR